MQRRHLSLGLALIVIIGVLGMIMSAYYVRGIVPGDAFTYLAAGERLNAGHPLYALSPGDRAVQIDPTSYAIPLVSPPPIAVLWRPLAALPNELGIWVWWLAQIAALTTSLAMLAAKVPRAAGVAMLVLSVPTVYEFGVGNVNSFLLLGLILVWRMVAEERQRPAGVLAAVMTAIKLTPAVMGWWLLVTNHRAATVWAVAMGAVLLGLSLIGAGVDAHLEYLRILGSGSAIGPYPLSLAGIAHSVGVPVNTADWLPPAGALGGLVAVWSLRRRFALSYTVAVATMIVGSPAVSINWYVLLYAILAPFAWPLRHDKAGSRERADPFELPVAYTQGCDATSQPMSHADRLV